jgi:hypothetical protein
MASYLRLVDSLLCYLRGASLVLLAELLAFDGRLGTVIAKAAHITDVDGLHADILHPHHECSFCIYI